MKKSIQLKEGQKFNRLTVVKLDHIKKQNSNNREYYLCKCDCENEIEDCQITSYEMQELLKYYKNIKE